MKGVTYQDGAAAAADTARALWPRADDVIDMLEWTLARDTSTGVPLSPGSPLQLMIFDGAKSVGMPRVECVFEETPHRVIIHELEFS